MSDPESQTGSEGDASNPNSLKQWSEGSITRHTHPTIHILSPKMSQEEIKALESKVRLLGGRLVHHLAPSHMADEDSNVFFVSKSKAPKLVAVWVKKAFKSQDIAITEQELSSLYIVSADWIIESEMCLEFTDPLPFKIHLSGDRSAKISSASAPTSEQSIEPRLPLKRNHISSSSSETESEDESKSKPKPTQTGDKGSLDKGKGKERKRSSSISSKRARISSESESKPEVSSPTKVEGTESDDTDWDSDSSLPEHLDQVTVLEPEVEIPNHKATMPFACTRATPYRCVNQALVDELNVIKDKRALYTPQNSGSLSAHAGLVKAIAAVKSFKYDLKDLPNPSSAAKTHINGVGESTERMLKEYFSNRKQDIGASGYSVKDCKIEEAEGSRNSKNVFKMMRLSKLKGLNPQKLKKYYQDDKIKSLRGLIEARKTKLGTGLPSQKVLQVRKDVVKKIGRREIELIRDEIVEELISAVPDLKHTLVGSYRRGHPLSDSVDLVFTSPNLGEAKTIDSVQETQKTTALLDELMDRLVEDGKTFQRVAIFSPKSYEDSQPISPVSNLSFAYLPSKSFKPSTSEPIKPIYRIVEINFCRPDVYGCQILARTGSRIFVTDLTKWATENDHTFHPTGLSSLESPEQVIPTPTEKDVFESLNLPYMPPHMRNCDP